MRHILPGLAFGCFTLAALSCGNATERISQQSAVAVKTAYILAESVCQNASPFRAPLRKPSDITPAVAGLYDQLIVHILADGHDNEEIRALALERLKDDHFMELVETNPMTDEIRKELREVCVHMESELLRAFRVALDSLE